MLSRRDKELAAEIGYQVRNGPALSGDLGALPASIAWPLAGLTAWGAYTFRDAHSLIWGTLLFLAMLCLALHAQWRLESIASRSFDIFLLLAYGAIFWTILSHLFDGEYWILTGLTILQGLVCTGSMIVSIWQSRKFGAA